MTAQSPSAYLSSAMLHAVAVVLLVGAAWVARQQTRPPVKIFDLVAGAGNNWAATEAPALGTPDGVKLKVPATAEPAPRIAEPAPAPPEPIAPAPLQEAPVPQAAPKTTDGKVPDLVRTVKRTAAKVEQKMAQKQRMEEAIAADKARKEAAAAKKIMTKEQYDKLYGKNGNPAGKAGTTKIARVDAEGIAGGVVGGSTANKVGGAGGKALSREEASLMDGYFSFLKQKLEQAHEPPVGVSDKLSVRVEFMLAVDGSISQVHIVRSSGNKDFDQSVLEAFKRVRPIGTRPDGRSEAITLEFNTRDEE
ncbi:MAG TPA: TonB family protein [Opitutaceae bacterium]|nr:TonB family protein [Opitutaceae bacterium]